MGRYYGSPLDKNKMPAFPMNAKKHNKHDGLRLFIVNIAHIRCGKNFATLLMDFGMDSGTEWQESPILRDSWVWHF